MLENWLALKLEHRLRNRPGQFAHAGPPAGSEDDRLHALEEKWDGRARSQTLSAILVELKGVGLHQANQILRFKLTQASSQATRLAELRHAVRPRGVGPQ